jgi:methyl-accepting chemotaxis protein
MAQARKQQKRRIYLVKKDFQLKFILKFCLILLAGVIVSTGLLFFLSQDTLTSSFQDSRLQIKSTGLAILPAVIYTNLFALGLVILAAIIVILFITHKIAGPLFRLEKELIRIGNGDLTGRITLRERDQITEIADSINKAADKLHQKVQEIQADVDGAVTSAERLNAPEPLMDALTRLQQKIANNFKI